MINMEKELDKLELMKSRVQLYKEVVEFKAVEINWAFENILGLNKSEIKIITSHYPTPGRPFHKIMKVKDWRKIRK